MTSRFPRTRGDRPRRGLPRLRPLRFPRTRGDRPEYEGSPSPTGESNVVPPHARG